MNIFTSLDLLIAHLSGANRKTPVSTPPEILEPYDGRTPLIHFGGQQIWTLNDAYMGVQVLGGTGSGKTSGSGAAIATSFLRQGFGGLILTAKPDEKALWQEYCAETGRDLTVFGPETGYGFNFLEYEYSRKGLGAGLTSNVAELFAAIAETNQSKAGSMDAYWMNALKQLLRRAIDLTTMAKSQLSLPMLLDLIMSAPQSLEEANSDGWKSSSFCAACLHEAEEKCTEANAPDFEHTKRYWLREFPALGDRTRSSIVSMFTVIADGFLTGPIRKLFCTRLNILPEETHAGKIILIDLPVEVFNEVGVCAQLVWKFCWQRATARREPDKDGGMPTFLWADESQFFTSSGDLKFQATARSKRACTVYLTQNLPTYFDRAGQDRTNALLGNLQTKIFHANGDHITNTYAADTIARSVTSRSSTNISPGGMSFGTSEAVDYTVPPAEFQRLRKGGPENNCVVDAYIFQAGREWPSTGESYLKASFKQPQRRK
jgi:NAD(P)-dependent dehydrogenase (short-subunit alcohol dehydrogenase family)